MRTLLTSCSRNLETLHQLVRALAGQRDTADSDNLCALINSLTAADSNEVQSLREQFKTAISKFRNLVAAFVGDAGATFKDGFQKLRRTGTVGPSDSAAPGSASVSGDVTDSDSRRKLM